MKKLFIIAAAALVGMASCAKEGPAKSDPNAEGTGSMVLFLNQDAKTRATSNGTATESQVNSLEIWVFEADGTTADATTPYVEIEDFDFGSFSEDESEYAPDSDGQFVTKINVAVGTGKKVLVIANANPAIGAQTGESMEEIMAILDGREFGIDNNRNDNLGTGFAGFVMAGQNLDFDVTAGQINTIEVNIDRNVSKIVEPTAAANVDFDALDQAQVDEMFSSAEGYTAGDVTAGNAMTFQLTGWAVLNGLPKSSAGFAYTASPYAYAPAYTTNPSIPSYGNEWTKWYAGEFTAKDWNAQLSATNGATELANGPRLESNSEELYEDDAPIENLADWTGVYSGVDGANSILKLVAGTPKSVYLYESKPGILTLNGYEGYNADQVISVIIEAEVASGAFETTRYWRINLRKDGGDAYHILRNSVYTISEIASISTPGHATPWEAEEEDDIIDYPEQTASEFKINVVPWNVLTVAPDQM